jgi:prophage regulatory protein
MSSAEAKRNVRVISYKDLKAQKGIAFSRQWLARLIALNRFPKPINLGEATVAFVEDEIDAWLTARVRERDERAEAEKAVTQPEDA